MNNTYNDYMQELREALDEFDQDFAAELLEDFESHFSEGIENGMTEEEICQELGPVESVLAELRESFQPASPDVPKITRIRPGEKSSRKETVSRLHVRLITASAIVQGGDVTDVVCDYNREDFSQRFEMYTEGGTLFLKEKPLPFFQRFTFSRGGAQFVFKVPSSVKNLDLSSTNGKLTLKHLEICLASLNTVNSRILGEHLQAESCDVHCVNGQIQMDGCLSQSMKASSVNGAVTIRGHYGTLELHSTNGALRVDADVKNTLALRTVNGSVTACYRKASGADIDLSTNCGNIFASFNDSHLTSRKKLRTSYGDKSLKITAHAQNGSIHLEETPKL